MSDETLTLLTMSDDQAIYPVVRAAFGHWNDVIHQLRESAYELRKLDETRQSEAMLIDAESMVRRARLHLGNLAARERDKLLPPPQAAAEQPSAE